MGVKIKKGSLLTFGTKPPIKCVGATASFLAPVDGLDPSGETVWDAFAAIGALDGGPSSEDIQGWSEAEMLIAYDWAIRERLVSLGSGVSRRKRPSFTIRDDHSTCTSPCGVVGCDPASNRDREAVQRHAPPTKPRDRHVDLHVDIVIEYPNHTRATAGVATTRRGIKRLAFGGGKTPFGKAHDGALLWRAILVGTASDLAAVGATYSDDESWNYIESGYPIPCEELLSRVTRSRDR